MTRPRRQRSERDRRVALFFKLVAGVLVLALVMGAAWWWSRLRSRPSTIVELTDIVQGVSYSRLELRGNNQGYWHVLYVDLEDPAVRVMVTPPDPASAMTHSGMPTSAFVERFNMAAAVNASFFVPFHSSTPWDYYPKRGEPVRVIGSSIADGERFSERKLDWPVFSIGPDRAWVRRDGAVDQARCAVAGYPMLIEGGQIVAEAGGTRGPRTVVGVNEDGSKLWLIVVDGRQGGYASGMTYRGLAEQMIGMGIHDALNLDGGGSSTMAARWGGRVQVLNAPYHTRIPMRERPVATHLGVYRDES